MKNITTDTHDFRASYTVGDSHEWHEIATNGYNLTEIVDDMLDFWNDADNRAEQFTVASKFNEDDATTVVEISGAVYGDDDGIVDTPIDAVIVQVTATER